ncbi:lysoplasmalogenase [Corynebacterium sp. H78]|uniref:lysoplasmalogenase n=1 Tax=Corynebacterium sp. H78 TaxID=3133417 RepID=UPI0030977D82
MASLVSSFVSRTVEGLGALNTVITGKPEQLGYIAAGAVNVVSSAFGWETPRKASKAVLMPLLAAGVIRRRNDVSPVTTATLLAGLTAGWIGDLVLMPKDAKLSNGAAAFSLNQLAYVGLLARGGARPDVARTAIRGPLMAGSVALAAKCDRSLLPVVFSYGSLLAAVSILADDRGLVATAGEVEKCPDSGLPLADARYGLGHGGNLFLISDSLLMLNSLVGKESVVGKLLDAAVMDTYIAAQLLLVEGLIALDPADD